MRLDNDDIVPLHRLDRLTSGLLFWSSEPETRSYYHKQFEQRTVRKRYRAELLRPLCGFESWTEIELPMLKVPGERGVKVSKAGTATKTRVRTLRDNVVELEPITGHTHQLRVLCSYLGAPIFGDDTYPVNKGLQLDNYSTELHLCATEVELALYPDGLRKMWTSPRILESSFWGFAG